MTDAPATYSKGQTVDQDGNYVCVPCGYHRYFRRGEEFTECISCLSGTKDGHEDFAEGLELWERAADQTPQ